MKKFSTTQKIEISREVRQWVGLGVGAYLMSPKFREFANKVGNTVKDGSLKIFKDVKEKVFD